MHLHIQHESSFYDNIHKLKVIFLCQVFSPRTPNVSPYYIPPCFVVMAETTAHGYIVLFSDLAATRIFQSNIHWSSPKQFAQHNTKMSSVLTKVPVKTSDHVVGIVEKTLMSVAASLSGLT